MLHMILEHKGHYSGHGINHEGQPFTGDLILVPILNGKGISLQFTATGKAGEVFHKEFSMIAPAADGTLALWNFNTNSPGLLQHNLVRTIDESTKSIFVFGFGDQKNRETFREEVALDIYKNGDVGYRYSWGLPGGDFKARSGAAMSPVAGG